MKNLCPNCYYIGKGKYNISTIDFILGIIMIIVGLLTFFSDKEVFESRIILNFLSIILIIIGAYITTGYLRGKICPICNHKPMLPLDNPEALKLIKKYDLQPGVNNVVENEQESDQTKAPTT